MDADVEARAYGGALDDPYDHALLEPASRALVAASADTTDVLVHDLRYYNRISVDADGTIARWKGVEPMVGEPTEERLADEDRGDAAPAVLPLLGPAVQDLLDAGDTGGEEGMELYVVLDQLDWNPVVSVEHELMVAMLEGRIETRRDALTVRHESMLAKEAAGAAALEPLLDALDRLGVEVLETAPHTGAVRVRCGLDILPALVELDGLAHVDLVSEETTSAGYPTGTEVTGTDVDGVEVENLLQSTQFYDAGYYGDSDGFIGMEEGGAGAGGHLVRRNHPGLDDVFGADRWRNCGIPIGPNCTIDLDPDPGNKHATSTASTLLGDLTRGQDATVPFSGERARSGVARRAHGLGTGASSTQVVQIMTASWRDIHMMNHSAGDLPVPCAGTSSYAQAWNTLYEDGVAVFMAAGNNGHTGSCSLKNPASALGVFTVGAYEVDSSDDEVIASVTSRGGGVFFDWSVPGFVPDGRTLVDVMGPTNHRYSYAWDSAASDQYPGGFCCTSGATPTVTGAAALFRDWYLNIEGTDIDSPGLLYANLLLMGDRLSESGSYLETGYDDLTGSGRLRLRKFNYLDGPAEWSDGSFCVDDGTIYTVEVAPSGLDPDVDMIKAVIWWYDHRHDSGSARHDKVDLRLQQYNDDLGLWSTVRTSDTDDNKQRVYMQIANPSTEPWRLRITGRDVTSDVEGCGLNSTRVYHAWLFEDQDRDTGTDLDVQIRPEG